MKKLPFYAACENERSIVSILLNIGADVNLSLKTKVGPLYAACKNGYKSIVRHLLEKDADVNLCSESDGSPIYAAWEN